MVKKIGNEWVFTGKFVGLNEEIRTIAEDQGGNIWLGSQFSGLVRITKGDAVLAPNDSTIEIARYDESHGMPGGEIKVGAVGQGVFFDTSQGLFAFDEEAQEFGPAWMLAEAFTDTLLTVQRAFEDDMGRVWVISNRAG